jgi:hypothetical protein
MFQPKRMNWISKKLVISVYVFIFSLQINAQNLTISSTGETGSSGTNWNLVGNTLTVTGTASIQASVITNALVSGSLTILGNTTSINVTVDQDITATTNGSGITIGNVNATGTVIFNRTVDIFGAITVYANTIRMGNALVNTPTNESAQLITRVSNGNISLFAKDGFETSATANCTRGKIMTAGGGNIHITSNADNNTSGTLNIDWITIDGNTGSVLLEGHDFVWNTGNACSLPEFYGTGHFTFRTTVNSNYGFNTAWLALYGNRASITIGKENNTEGVTISPCTVCNGTPINGSGQTLTAKTSGAVVANGEFNRSDTPATAAANLAATINTVASLVGVVTATAAAGVVTLTASVPGLVGNGLILTEAMANTTVTAFSGGTNGTVYTLDNA